MTIHVMLVDDHAVVRSGYRRLIDAEPGLRVVAEVETLAEAQDAMRLHEVNVVVMDLTLREESGLEGIKRLSARYPHLRILVFSMHDHTVYVTQALRHGALGYITKYARPMEMISALRKVAAGQRAFSSDVSSVLAAHAVQGQTPLHELSPREFEVLRMTAHGLTPSDIAHHLKLSPKTVFNHLSMIRNKLNLRSDVQLYRLALQEGLVTDTAPTQSDHRFR